MLFYFETHTVQQINSRSTGNKRKAEIVLRKNYDFRYHISLKPVIKIAIVVPMGNIAILSHSRFHGELSFTNYDSVNSLLENINF